jgi:FNIP Repeat
MVLDPSTDENAKAAISRSLPDHSILERKMIGDDVLSDLVNSWIGRDKEAVAFMSMDSRLLGSLLRRYTTKEVHHVVLAANAGSISRHLTPTFDALLLLKPDDGDFVSRLGAKCNEIYFCQITSKLAEISEYASHLTFDGDVSGDTFHGYFSSPNLKHLMLSKGVRVDLASLSLPASLESIRITGGGRHDVSVSGWVYLPRSVKKIEYHSCGIDPRLMREGLEEIVADHLTWRASLPTTVKRATLRNWHGDIEPGVFCEGLVFLRLSGQPHTFVAGALPSTLRCLHVSALRDPLLPGVLPDGLEELELRTYCFPIPPGVLPTGLKRLKLIGFDDEIEAGALPAGLEALVIGADFDLPIGEGVIPQGLKYLRLPGRYEEKFPDVVNGIESVRNALLSTKRFRTYGEFWDRKRYR